MDMTFGIKGLWDRWMLDRDPEIRSFTAAQLHEMVLHDQLNTHAFVRHAWTGRFALVAEVLLANRLISQKEFDLWVPKPYEKIGKSQVNSAQP
ncbi:MAG: hypothetical protein JST40_09675 [Armatimonadetes bacterium]|nr:hypothetical protein [Armatimonadota bacterium]